MNRKVYISIVLLAGIAMLAIVLLRGSKEPIYHFRELSWWVDQYGNYENPPERRANARVALSSIGTNAVPYLMGWINNVDTKLSQTNDEDLRIRMWLRAGFAATAFSALGTNAISYIPKLTSLAINPSNGNVALIAEEALAQMGPDGFTAALDVIATPGLPQRGLFLQSIDMAEHLSRPDSMTLVGHADADWKTNSVRAAPILLKCLDDSNPAVQRWAFRLLGDCDAGVMVPALTNFLASSPSPAIRGQAMAALAKHGGEARTAVPFLFARLSNSDLEIRAEATNALMQIAPDALANPKQK